MVPDSREIREIPGKPGWFEISGGHLKELYDQQLDLVDALEKCEQRK